MCTSGGLDEEDVDGSLAGPESTDTQDTLSGWVPTDEVIWRGKKELGVKFLNTIPSVWTYDGSGMNTGNIISWANRWSDLGNGVIPKFFHVKKHNARSDIRVEFTGKS